MKKLLIFGISILAISALMVFAGASCQNKTTEDNNTDSEDVTTESTEAENNTLTTDDSTVETDTTVVKADESVYANDSFGYQVTLPEGYRVEADDGDEKVVVYDSNGNKFATMWTPLPDMTFDEWEQTGAVEIPVPDSEVKLTWIEALPLAGSGVDYAIVTVGWGVDEGVVGSNNGFILHEFNPDDTTTIALFQAFVNSLRFK